MTLVEVAGARYLVRHVAVSGKRCKRNASTTNNGRRSVIFVSAFFVFCVNRFFTFRGRMSTAGTDSPIIIKKRTTILRVAVVLPLWNGNLPTSKIAKKLDVTTSAVQDFARRHHFPKRSHIERRRPSKIVDPTPEEIAERAAEVRARRTERENARLNNDKPMRVEIRQYAYDSRRGLFTEM